MPTALPSGLLLRPAQHQDLGAIRWLVLGAKLDPTQLRWSQFWVIEHAEQVIACGQLRSFPAAQELGSLVVAKHWRRQGLGSALTQHLIQQATEPLYLECLGSTLAQFYQRLGFQPVSWQKLPRSLQRKFGLSAVAARFGFPVFLMHYDPSQNSAANHTE
ncbi:GNAT family N-acetyltransferase [Pantanalinema sp. GBBB05]|uniref:GNAT family N-acetyltransferase n=1 Tax=Pantanalinema sp. GBBB05 TaxID=2604139 RepID=UPI001D60E206|nr:GNAT family N-acetyltransferase [Pantanalinema sp. GBBB05]